MNRAEELFHGHAFRKSLPDESRKSPINKSLFEVWSSVLSSLTYDEYQKLLLNKRDLLKVYKEALGDLEFLDAISRHSSTPKGISDSYSKIQRMVKGMIKEGSE